jgi:hypothetical protein
VQGDAVAVWIVELELLGHGLQAISLFINSVGKCLCHFGKLALGLLLLQLVSITDAALQYPLLAQRLDVRELNDVEAEEIGFDHVTSSPFFSTIWFLFKRFYDHCLAKEVQIHHHGCWYVSSEDFLATSPK